MSNSTVHITLEQVRRFTLGAHFLIKKVDKDLISIIDRVCGLNSQTARGPYISLWSRIKGFKQHIYDDALYRDRKLIKTWLMRGTVHTVSTDDFAIYQKALRRIRSERWIKTLTKRSLMPLGKTRDKFEQELTEVLATGSFTKKELLKKTGHLIKSYPDKKKKIILGRSLRTLAYRGLVCHAEPTGPWYHFKENRFTTVKRWAPEIELESIDGNEAMQKLLTKYLKGYGPTSIKDFAYWAGISVAESKRVFEDLKEMLIEVKIKGVKGDFWILKDDVGRLEALKKGKFQVTFLPEFDSLIMGHKEKVRILDDRYKKKVFLRLANVAPVILVDGEIIGVWNHKVSDCSFNLSIFGRIGKKLRGEIDRRSKTLKKFLETK